MNKRLHQKMELFAFINHGNTPVDIALLDVPAAYIKK